MLVLGWPARINPGFGDAAVVVATSVAYVLGKDFFERLIAGLLVGIYFM